MQKFWRSQNNFSIGNRLQARVSNALPLRGLSLIQPDLMIQAAGCQQGVVSDQLGLCGEQECLISYFLSS
jgi:hypothetical protein